MFFVFIGSIFGGQDVIQSRNVGLQTSVVFFNISLNIGITYFATVKGTANGFNIYLIVYLSIYTCM